MVILFLTLLFFAFIRQQVYVDCFTEGSTTLLLSMIVLIFMIIILSISIINPPDRAQPPCYCPWLCSVCVQSSVRCSPKTRPYCRLFQCVIICLNLVLCTLNFLSRPLTREKYPHHTPTWYLSYWGLEKVRQKVRKFTTKPFLQQNSGISFRRVFVIWMVVFGFGLVCLVF